MNKTITIALALSALAPLSAQAQERMSDTRYIAAQECLAYANLSQLQSDGINFSGLQDAVRPGFRDSAVSSAARENARRVRARANNLAATANGMQELREQRDAACANFVASGLVNAASAQAAGAP